MTQTPVGGVSAGSPVANPLGLTSSQIESNLEALGTVGASVSTAANSAQSNLGALGTVGTVGASVSTAANSGSGSVVLALVLELAGVGALVVIADSGPEGGQIALLFTVGLWLLFLVAHPSGLAFLNSAVSRVQKGATT
jgi:hypothetical protein